MKFLTTIPLIACAIAAAPAANAAETVSVPRFDQVELNGGGIVTIRHGAVQRVTLLSGSSAVSRLRVVDGRLEIDACERSCPRNYKLEVELVVPRVEAAAVNGGGTIAASGSFPRQGAVAAAVNGGGDISLRAIPARAAAASIKGGGHIGVHAASSLTTSISGGGSVTYWGEPHITTSINGGGNVRKGR